VWLVATHADERTPDLNHERCRTTFSQLVDLFSVSNKDGRGIDDLAIAIVRHAARLRLMGQPWPQRWVRAEQRLLAFPDHHINADAYASCCQDCALSQRLLMVHWEVISMTLVKS
jgi:hypothetical protein